MSASLTVIDNAPLTEMQERFAYGLSLGLGPTQTAQIVGYANPSVQGARNMRDPRIRVHVRALRGRRIDKLASLGLHVLESLLKDPKISPAVRLKAAETVLSLAGHVAPKAMEPSDAFGNKPISDMTIDELDAFIEAERVKRADAAKPVIDGTTTT